MAGIEYDPLGGEAPVAMRSPLEEAQRALGWAGLRHGLAMRLFRLATEWLPEEPLLTESLHILEDTLRAEAGSVIMLDRHEDDLYFAAATGPVSEDIKHFRLDRTEGIAGWCMETGRVVRINNVQDEERWHGEITQQIGFDVRQMIAAPIRVKDRMVGCLELINKLVPGEDFTIDDEEVVAEAAECVGILFALRGRRPDR